MSVKIQARIDETLKTEGELILKKIGLTTTELMKMTFRQLVIRKGLPFEATIPNVQTLKSFDEANNPSENITYKDAKSALDDVWDED
ncbi:MAG: type II toxin-antitoxin system RelB/DinJ family antitoxin [Xanthomonadales bacterium]|nr:type II toxin-antitoxin system RelB/DinJ family antitoxin [Xanthomonadales bacterium]